MDRIKLVCPCLLGVEGLVADELRAMEAQNVEPQNGRVLFEGDAAMLVRVNLGSRSANGCWCRWVRFPARTFQELFQGVKGLPWERWIGEKEFSQ